MNQFLTQLPALIGVVVGAGGSYLATSTGARTQWARSERARWEDKRIQVYAEYGHALKRAYELSKRISASRGLPTTAQPTPVEQGLAELSLTSIRGAELWESLLLLGEPSTIAAAKAWHQKIWRMEAFANGQLTDPAEWRKAITAADETRSRFYETARRNLGIDDGRLSGPTPRSPRRPGRPSRAEL